MPKAPKTPCIGVCSTGIGDTVCRGCKRFAQEVIQWNGYTAAEKQAVLDRLDSLLAQTVKPRFVVVDVEQLREQMTYQQLSFNPDKSPYCWVFDLLRQGAGQIADLRSFGVQRRAEYADYSLPALKQQIDKDYYTLSCAYYERYILPGETAQAPVTR